MILSVVSIDETDENEEILFIIGSFRFFMAQKVDIFILALFVLAVRWRIGIIVTLT